MFPIKRFTVLCESFILRSPTGFMTAPFTGAPVLSIASVYPPNVSRPEYTGMVGFMVEAAQMALVLANVFLLIEPLALIFSFKWSLKKDGFSVMLPV